MGWRGGVLAAGILLWVPAGGDVGTEASELPNPMTAAISKVQIKTPAEPPTQARVSPTPTTLARASTCNQKRTDACGCHHYYGVRHCHAKLRTDRCQKRVEWRPAEDAHDPQHPKLAWVTAGP